MKSGADELINVAPDGIVMEDVPAVRLEALRREFEASDCAKTYPDAKSIVFGRGSADPRVVFIGEAPGREEDEQGLPFVGRSGKLLDIWFDYLGLTEDDYYITSVMKTRPPNNRNPTAGEVKRCSAWLDRQLGILEPELVVCLGRFAMRHFFPKLTSVLPNTKRLIDDRFVILPHPSYFIRRGGAGWEPYLDPLKRILHDRERSGDEP